MESTPAAELAGDPSTGGVGGSAGTVAAGTGGRSSASARGGSGTAAGTASAAVGPGVTGDKIYIGLGYTVNGAAANAALGAPGITQGDEQAEYKIVLDDINSHGGVAGRKLEPVWHGFDATTTGTGDQLSQEACDDWTTDHKVFAIFSGGEALLQCVASKGVVAVEENLTSADAARFARYPFYVELSNLNLDRMAATQVVNLKPQGYFGGWDANAGAAVNGKAPKIGIVTHDEPSFSHAVEQTMVPALRKLGYTVDPADVIKAPAIQRTSDAGAVGAAMSSAVLKFRSDNVTHVFVFDERGLLTLLFLQNADSQRFYPRYAFNTQNGVQTLKDGANIPSAQLRGSKGIGWIPALDIRPVDNPDNGPYSNDARRRCVKLYTDHGTTFADSNAESIALGICNSLYFFRDAVKLGGNVVNRAAFINGVNRMGTSWVSGSIFGTRFSATQHDAVQSVRYLAYVDSCDCMRYTSNPVETL